SDASQSHSLPNSVLLRLLLVYTVDQHDALFIIDLAQADFDDFGGARLHDTSGELRFDWHLTPAAVDQHAKRHALRTPEVEQTVHRCANRAAGVQNVVDQHEVHVVDTERNVRRFHHGVRGDLR